VIRRLLALGALIALAAAGCSDEHGTRGGLPELRPGRAWRVPGDRPTISDALRNVQTGDTIFVACGVYEEHDLMVPNGIVLTSETGLPGCVVIDAGGRGRVISCIIGVNETTEIVGLTLTGGEAAVGAGMWFAESSPRIYNCVIRDNLADGAVQGGGGILCYRSSPVFTDCVIMDNTATRSGGGVHCEGSSPHFIRCTITGNTAFEGGGAFLTTGSRPRFIDCSFLDNRASGDGGAILCREESTSLVEGCTFASNLALGSGGAIHLSSSSCSLRTSTLVGDEAELGSALFTEGDSRPVVERVIIAFGLVSGDSLGAVVCDGGSAVVRCSNIFGNAGGDWDGCIEDQAEEHGNISEDPLFCDPGSRDFRLQPDSPCLGDTLGCPDMGAWPAGCGKGCAGPR